MKSTEKHAKLYMTLAAMCLTAALLVLSLTYAFSDAKYVTEMEGGNLDYETQMPAEIGSQQDLFNAITSGYGYVKLSDKLTGPIIMTGDSLDLKRDLTIDLNDKEIQRNSRDSLITIPSGKTLTIVDTGKKTQGGLYNPIGSVLTVRGGRLNVYGGKFESGPRPKEYVGKLTDAQKALIDEINKGSGISVTLLNPDGSDSSRTAVMPILPLRSADEGGNVYFDEDYYIGGNKAVDRDTYCYVAVDRGDGVDFNTFDVSKADFAYKYRLTSDGLSYTTSEGEGTIGVMVFGYNDDIEASMAESVFNAETGKTEAPGYAAVSMQNPDSVLNVNVTATNKAGTDAGSFYSYFGTWHTYCVLMNGGTMTVSTSGKFATVDPDSLPPLKAGETRNNSAKYGENACILCTRGVLDIRQIASAESYNGSAISVSGGTVNMQNTSIIKTATISHGDDPFKVGDEPSSDGGAGVFPEGRQYRDAALFINGGTLNLDNTTVTVNKNITDKYPLESGQTSRPKTTIGILSRGRPEAEVSSLTGNDLTFDLRGTHSYGIFATRGNIDLTGSSFTLEKDNASYGVFAVNKIADAERAVNIKLKNCNILLGEEKTYEGLNADGTANIPQDAEWVDKAGKPCLSSDPEAMRAASVGVYLDSSKYPGGKVLLDNSEIHSQEMGVAVDNGTLTFVNGGKIHAYNASAVNLRGGNIYLNNNVDGTLASYEVKCYINRVGLDSDQCMAYNKIATEAGIHRYNIYMPWQVNDDGSIGEPYENTNGVRVVGGTFESEALFGCEFRGLYNDFDLYDTSASGDDVYFDNVVIKSFAVACTQDSGRTAVINIRHADILSSVGGGVKVQGGSVTLGSGASDSIDGGAEDIIINTTGNVHYFQHYPVAENLNTATFNTWRFYPNLSGGHAVIARDGNITVYNGKYAANYCNGISATGDNTRVRIYGGTFTGNMVHSEHSYKTASGPASFYGMKVMGASDVMVYGGTFDGKNGGAFIRGADPDSTATVYVYRGKFGKRGGGQDGVVVSDYSTVYFGAFGVEDLRKEGLLGADETSNKNLQSLISVDANLYPISVNRIAEGTAAAPHNINIYVYYGTYYVYNPAPVTVGGVLTFTRGIGHVDGSVFNVLFRIYGMGSNVYDQNPDIQATNPSWHLIDGYIRAVSPEESTGLNTGCDTQPQYCRAKPPENRQ